MKGSSDLRVASAFDAEAPARADFSPIAARPPFEDFETERLELVARGDFVSGVRIRGPRLKGSRAPARGALLLLVHDTGAQALAPAWSALTPWVRRGLDLVALDLPLHGPRASAKLSERLVGGLAGLARGAALDRNASVLVEEFRRQAVRELGRTLDALLGPGGYEEKRAGVLGLGLGAWIASDWLGHDRRLAAAVLVATDRAPGPAAITDRGPGPDCVVIEQAAGGTGWLADAERVLASRLGF